MSLCWEPLCDPRRPKRSVSANKSRWRRPLRRSPNFQACQVIVTTVVMKILRAQIRKQLSQHSKSILPNKQARTKAGPSFLQRRRQIVRSGRIRRQKIVMHVALAIRQHVKIVVSCLVSKQQWLQQSRTLKRFFFRVLLASMPPTRRMVHIIKEHRALFSRSIFSMIDIYNNLPQSVVDAPSVSSFQSRLTEIARKRCKNLDSMWHLSFCRRDGPDLDGSVLSTSASM